jgi:aminoglycoside phosphotransferase (APT) family kinase protein
MDGGRLSDLAGPTASVVESHWQAILEGPFVLTHHDFWSGNVVWQDGRLSGIVDWNGGSLGPRGFDVGWCRLDLFLLYDDLVADVFLRAYETAYGTRLPSPALWDLWAAARSHKTVKTWEENYLDLGRHDLTAAALRKRHAEWTSYSRTDPGGES